MTQRAGSGRSIRASAAKLRTVAKVKEPKGQNTDGHCQVDERRA